MKGTSSRFVKNAKVSAIFFNDESQIQSDGELSLELVEEYCGDHSEWWVRAIVDGKELYRHNTRYIACIEWGD